MQTVQTVQTPIPRSTKSKMPMQVPIPIGNLGTLLTHPRLEVGLTTLESHDLDTWTIFFAVVKQVDIKVNIGIYFSKGSVSYSLSDSAT